MYGPLNPPSSWALINHAVLHTLARPTQAKPGSGRITSSGTIVTGYDTKFLSELKVHDAIIVQHPTTCVRPSLHRGSFLAAVW